MLSSSTRRTSSITSSWMDAMNRSTIYERHLQRRIHTIQSINDPRPSVVRVMAGIPVLRMLCDPYDPTVTTTTATTRYNDDKNNDSNHHHQQLQQQHDYSDTFSTMTDCDTPSFNDTTVFTSYP